jgi:predicted NAD-dependent protein-ADP-ribosyltransferase YbiA (DUF1768 family)
MYGKAVLFNDEELAQEILDTTYHIKAKHYGRKVRGFDDRKC